MDDPPMSPAWATTSDDAPVDAAAVGRAAAAAGLTIPEACVPGVVMNLALLGRHAAILEAP